ncbi:hypothetical protein AXZ95_2416 [Leifsonia sp. 115AMFTsu3.1]|nr:hypothetical protein AXZ95_2416 [Leifsonia sp. 115AMFTsu3.1]
MGGSAIAFARRIRQRVTVVRGMRRKILVAGAALAAIGGLATGCTAAPAHDRPTHAAHPASNAHPTPTPTRTADTSLADEYQYLPPAGTVMGTGRFDDVEGHATGDVTVSVAPDLRFQVVLSAFSTTAQGATVALSVDRFGATAGAPTVPAHDDPVGVLEATSGDQVLPFDSSGRTDRGNLSYFNSVELVINGTVEAAAPITWTIPDFYPGLTVKDSGPRPYARGTVSLYDGQPAAYAVWGNDNSQAVADRFGITQDQLFYLNPQLRRGDTTLLRDTSLNLSVAYR